MVEEDFDLLVFLLAEDWTCYYIQHSTITFSILDRIYKVDYFIVNTEIVTEEYLLVNVSLQTIARSVNVSLEM